MSIKCGIVGLPNVGKSTFFNAVSSSAKAASANYPFCTIEPNNSRVAVPSAKLIKIAEIAGSKEIIPSFIEFVDIAGLVKGASSGEGLGNKFLGHIREVDAIIHVLRCFEDSNITHVNNKVAPLEDLEIISMELVLADLSSMEKMIIKIEKEAKRGNKAAIEEFEIAQLVIKALSDGKYASSVGTLNENKRVMKRFGLLTAKPCLYICNMDENDLERGNAHSRAVETTFPGSTMRICAQIEAEISDMDAEDKKIFMSDLGIKQSGLEKIILASYELLGLHSYFTAGPKEARSWAIKKGSKAPVAAGVIHTDFEKGFIKAEVISYDDYIEYKGEAGAREAGKLRIEGKDYTIENSDVVHFRFNV